MRYNKDAGFLMIYRKIFTFDGGQDSRNLPEVRQVKLVFANRKFPLKPGAEKRYYPETTNTIPVAVSCSRWPDYLYSRGEFMNIEKSVCRICHGGCGTLVHVDGGRVVKVRPDPDWPFSKGRMCIKGLSTPDIMYHKDRLLYPLRRSGPRGGGSWERVSWETALSEIAEKLGHIRETSGPESVALGQGTGRHHYTHVIRFANTFGTPNWYEPGLANCFIPRITASILTCGKYVVADHYGPVKPKTLIFWGHNPLISCPDGELGWPVLKELKSGTHGIAIDPFRSETARHCQEWVPIRPGTDCALALAMIHAVIFEDWTDQAFVENWTLGYNRLREHVREYTPDWAAGVTGVPAATIYDIARRYALDKPSAIEWGVALEHTPNSLQAARAITILRGLTGNVDNPGGDIMGMNILRPYPVLKNELPKGMLKKRIGAGEFKLLGGFRAFMPSAHIPGVFRAMRHGDPYRIRALCNFGSNPLASIANPKNVRAALEKLDLLVVSELFMTPTAALADYILPAAFWPEVEQLIELPFVVDNAVAAHRKLVSTGECRQNEEILIDLARRLGLPGSEASLEDILDFRLEPLGIDFQQLKARGLVYPPHEYEKYREKGFHTPSKKFELFSKSLARMGYDPMPVYREPPESPVSTPELAREFPCVLTTGGRIREFFHSELRQVDALRKRHPDPLARIHTETASAHGIQSGDWIRVSSPRGQIRMKAEVSDKIGKGVVSIDHGWWFPEKQGPDFGIWESNANLLTSDGPPYDPAFGTYQLRGLLCRIEKVGPAGERTGERN